MNAEEAKTRLLTGDLEKPFHRCECECDQCAEWRLEKRVPTRKQLHIIAGHIQPPEAKK